MAVSTYFNVFLHGGETRASVFIFFIRNEGTQGKTQEESYIGCIFLFEAIVSIFSVAGKDSITMDENISSTLDGNAKSL